MNWKEQQNILDPIPSLLYQAYQVGADKLMSDSNPCSTCKVNKALPRTHFHGSEVGACKRKVFYTVTQGKKPNSSNTAFLQDGHLNEASMLTNINAGGMTIQASNNLNEVVVDITEANDQRIIFKIIGHTDGILLFPKHLGSKYLIECKSVKDYTWKSVKDGKISDEWYGQMQLYLGALDLQVGYLLIKNRMTSQILMPIRIERNDKYMFQRVLGFKEIFSKLLSGDRTLPDREHTKATDSECKFCPFAGECWVGIDTSQQLEISLDIPIKVQSFEDELIFG